ncbi:type II toxin-antitoxin system RelE/ParE family toxin [Nodularia spumigena]|jgi:hypothetical protein|nr:type II toxin-antitoxin system RelE/ParE family toxin [Nodularia spumigena]AHJ29713.1 hypothetical protein NSP_33890 [Nodularia spumigena CCY9414]EAW44002.1 hypothetical protein N9414_22753 [Nodularia spumigena CCY9414]
MYKQKNSNLLDSKPSALVMATDSTFQSSNSTTFLVIRKSNNMAYEVEYTDEFEQSWLMLDGATQVSIDIAVKLLEEKGPNLPFPRSSDVKGSRHRNMRELRVQHKGEPYRVLYAFDPRRVAILLLLGNKVGNDRWYEQNVPKADKLYDQYIRELTDEGLV